MTNKNKMIFWIVGMVILLLFIIVASNLIFGPTKTQITDTVSNQENINLPGLQTSKAPWPAEVTQLKERLISIGLPVLSQEGTALHIHQHIDIYIHGKSVPIPEGIGINEAEKFISPIHVHDTTGIIHVESPIVQKFNLGQFFDIWGVSFTKDSIGGYAANASSTLQVYIDGKEFSGNPRDIELTPYEEIVVVYGTPKEFPKNMPIKYAFPSGL